MSKVVFMFSGQGSQHPGMGEQLCSEFARAREVYETASQVMGYDVRKLSKEGSEAELSRTIVSQPLIYTLSMAVYAVLAQQGIRPDAVAGFSLGECSALTAAGAMDLHTGLKVIGHRAAAMQHAAEETGGTMFAVLGTKSDELEAVCQSVEGYVIPVNYNCPGQIVIAGEEKAAEAAAEILTQKGRRVVRLAVNAAFHSELMRGASERFYSEIRNLPFSAPQCRVYSNITGKSAEIPDIPDYLRRQMTSPVRFIDEMEAMSGDGFDTFVELGPGKTLCGFIRKGIRGARFFSVEDTPSLEKCLEALRGTPDGKEKES